MHFRRADRRPDGRVSRLRFVLLPLLPFLIAGGDAPLSLSDPAMSPGLDLPKPVWIFLSREAWDGARFWDALEDVPVEIRVRSEWLRGVSVDVSPEWTGRLEDLPGVLQVRSVVQLQPTRRKKPALHSLGEGRLGGLLRSSEEPTAGSGPAPQNSDSIYGELGPVLDLLGVPQAHALGFTGTGVRIGILDGTFSEGHATLRTRPPMAVRDFVDLDGSVFSDPADPPEAASHGTALWSLISADLKGVLRGGAPGGDLLLARIRGMGELAPVDEDRWVAGLEWLESQGARIVLSGVSFRDFDGSRYTLEELNGDVTPATRAADQAASRGVLVVAPVGNRGPGFGSLEAPADGDSVLAVGAIDNRGIPTAFSALGPTGDGRSKPDLLAPGLELTAASALGDQTLEPVTGTEFAGALLAGASALLVEAYPDRGPMEILDFLRASRPPDMGAEVGVPDVASAIVFPQGVLAFPVEEVDGEGRLTNLAPLFRWNAPTLHPLGLPVTFHVEFSEDSLFRTVLVTDSVVGTFARRISTALPPLTRLYWRIRGTSAQGIGRNSGTAGPLDVPSWVTLEVLDDPGGSELVDPQPVFRWSAPDLFPPLGPFSFELQVVSERETEILQSYPGLDETELHLPDPLPFNVPLRWRVIAQVVDGTSADTVTSAGPFVVTSGANPPATLLYQNFPNPFPNPELGVEETRVWFDLAQASTVELGVYDLRGRLVKQLIPGNGCPSVELPPGVYGREGGSPQDPCQSFSWDGTDERDRSAPPGVYLLRLKAAGVVDVRRMVLRK